jgi:hypothetical protein
VLLSVTIKGIIEPEAFTAGTHDQEPYKEPEPEITHQPCDKVVNTLKGVHCKPVHINL